MDSKITQSYGRFSFLPCTDTQGSAAQVVQSRATLSLRPRGLYSLWNSPGQNTGVGSPSLPQGILPMPGSNPGLPNCGRIRYQLSHQGGPTQTGNRSSVRQINKQEYLSSASAPRGQRFYFKNWKFESSFITFFLSFITLDWARSLLRFHSAESGHKWGLFYVWRCILQCCCIVKNETNSMFISRNEIYWCIFMQRKMMG